ncbi:hypothetical protein JZ751_006312 [Albula glossodonta]|uniref:NACHT domain-containing protein n=1 Tax=Albula glossodonta TaxID=121402 RepID=A0A8T2N390_9TELE|nr:hypothetical protein JZ751_006312 [Albula glossodonta]
MQEVPMDLQDDILDSLESLEDEDLLQGDLLRDLFSEDLSDLERDCFSPAPSEPALEDGILDNIIKSLFEGHQGYLCDEAAVPASPSRPEQVSKEVKSEDTSLGKRGLSAHVTPEDQTKAKRRRRAPPRSGPKIAKVRRRKPNLRQTSECEKSVSTETPAKGLVTITAPPGLVQLSLHVPIFTPANGGSSFQVIQAFTAMPQQVINIPVSNGMSPGGPTYVLVPSPSLTPSSQVMPRSPAAGTVVPPDQVVSAPVTSSSDSANKAWPSAPVSCPSPQTEVPPCTGSTSSTPQGPPDPEKPKCVEEYIETAKSLMRDSCKITATETGADLEMLYVDVGLVQRQVQVKTGRNANKCLEKELVVLGDCDRRRAAVPRGRVFEDEAGQRRPTCGRSIALLGKSGAGKTAFVRRLCLDWANGALPRFDFLFLLEGRSLNVPLANHSLKSLLFNLSVAVPPCSDSDTDTDNVFRHVLGSPQRVLIIFDGFDDFRDYDSLLQSPATNQTKDGHSVKQLFSGLFQKKLLAGCTLLIAARPKEVLNQFLGKVDRILEVPGFTPEEIELYASRYFTDSSCRDRALKKLSESGYAFSLCSNPFICRSVCFLLEHQDASKALPSTLTGLWQAVTHQQLCAIGREEEGAGKGERVGEEPWVFFPKLCRAAWTGVKSHNSVLSTSELKMGQEMTATTEGGGILAPHIRWDGEGKGPEAGYGFTHLLPQAFLAALHLSQSPDVSDRTMLAQMAGQPRKRRLQADWLESMCRFTVGLLFQKRVLFQDWFPNSGASRGRGTAAKKTEVTAHLKRQKPCELSPGKLLELCHCVYETGDPKLGKRLVKSLPENLSFSGTPLDPPDVFVLRRLLLNAKSAKRSFSLDLQETGINVPGLKELLGLKCISSFRASIGDMIRLWEELQQQNAEVLLRDTVAKFTINPFKATQLSHVDDLTQLVQIYREKKLPICNPGQSESILDKDSFNIPAMKNLQRLDFELGAQNGPVGFSKLLKILPDLRWLQHLDLEDLKIGDSEAEKLAEVLPALSSLEMLNLYSNLIGDGGAENLATVLPQMMSLTDLEMWNHFIPHSVLERLKQRDSRIRTL